MAKKKKTLVPKKQDVEDAALTTIQPNSVANNEHQCITCNFKNKKYQEKKTQRKKFSKGLKQIILQEKTFKLPPEAVQYANIDAPPSFRPSKKYSDLSGFQSTYTDPQSHLRFCMAEEYQTIQTLPGDIISGYLALRKAFTPV